MRLKFFKKTGKIIAGMMIISMITGMICSAEEKNTLFSDQEEKISTEKTENVDNTEKITHKVGIDPGHQGSWVDMSDSEPNGPGSSVMKTKCTTGTTGKFTNVPEYELNLTISKLLEEELQKRGYETVLTREDHDKKISNSERALYAASEGSEIYVRIHANGSDDTSIKGALAMVPSSSNPYVKELAEDSYLLGKDILDHYCEKAEFKNLGIQYTDDMTGINWSKVPVMILEMGFMSNEEDDTRMQKEDVQKKMAEGIADGIDAYFQEKDKESEEVDIETLMLEKRGNENIITDGLTEEIRSNFIADREKNGEVWAFSVENLKTEEIYEYQGNREMQSASVIKVFIMGAVYDRICYPKTPEREIHFNESYDGELRNLLEQMITVSSNEAANELIRRLGEGDFHKGAQVIYEFCQENGYFNTSVGRAFLESNPTGDNYTSASDCRKILADIYRGKCVNEEASAKMLGILKGQTVRHKIPAGLPAGYTSANKTGEMPEGYNLGCIENDIAIVFREQGDYVITVLSNELHGRNDEADGVITRISSYVAEHLK